MAEQEIVDAEIVEETPATEESKGPLQVAVIGQDDDPLTIATAKAFNVPRGVEVSMYTTEDLDALVEAKPNIVFYCEEIPVKKNDSLDDGDFIAAIQKLIRIAGAGVCIRSTLNVEAFERLIMSLTKQVFDNKIVYMPDLTDSSNVEDIISSPVHLIGGTGEALQQHMSVLGNMSWFSARELVSGSVPEIIYTKLAATGYRMVQAKFFNELYDAVMDIKNANPMLVSRQVQKVLGVCAVPSQISDTMVYDGRIFAGATDKLTLIESCLGD
tara:strand:+ start:2753 stop:3562 length:810 start_codon:yes stop_codon:yes gene_type:complete